MVQRTAEIKLALLRQHDNGVVWTRIAAESGVPVRTLTRWAIRYRADPSSRALERPRRGDRGTRKIAPELVEVVEALALSRPEQTAAFIHRRVCLDTHIQLIHSRVGVPQGRGKIERFYGTITTELLPHLPGHIPHGTNGASITPATLTAAIARPVISAAHRNGRNLVAMRFS